MAFGHALRLVYGLEAVVGDWMVPMWVSYIGVLLPAGLAYMIRRQHQGG